jgi:hypothetical protein
MDTEELKKRTKDFAHRCVKIAIALPKTTLGNHIRGQFYAFQSPIANQQSTIQKREIKP